MVYCGIIIECFPPKVFVVEAGIKLTINLISLDVKIMMAPGNNHLRQAQYYEGEDNSCDAFHISEYLGN